MKKMQLLLAAIMGLTSAAYASNPGGNGITILGDVLNHEGKPVEGGKVFITNVCTNQVIEIEVDAAKGSFLYSGESCGTYILEVRAKGFKSTGKVLTPDGDKPIVVSLEMEAEKAEAKPEKSPAQSFNPNNGTIEKKV